MSAPSPQRSCIVDAQKDLWGYLRNNMELWNADPREMQVLPLGNTLIPHSTPAPGRTEVTLPFQQWVSDSGSQPVGCNPFAA